MIPMGKKWKKAMTLYITHAKLAPYSPLKRCSGLACNLKVSTGTQKWSRNGRNGKMQPKYSVEGL